MQERSFIHAMLHMRKPGEPLAQFREQLRGLTLEDRQWFVGQFAKEFDIEIVANPTLREVGIISTALAVIAQPVTYSNSFIKEYLGESDA